MTKKTALQFAKHHLPTARGGVWVDIEGYISFRFVKGGKTYRFHRWFMEQRIGRKLKSCELVHHRDENRLNNAPDNLRVVTHARHRSIHQPVWTAEMRRELSSRRVGSCNPNFGNHKKREPKPRSEVERMRRNQPGYVRVAKEDLIQAIRTHRRPVLVQQALGITAKVFNNRCAEFRICWREVVPV